MPRQKRRGTINLSNIWLLQHHLTEILLAAFEHNAVPQLCLGKGLGNIGDLAVVSSHAALLLKALQPACSAELADWHRRFVRQLPTLLAGELKTLESELVWQCLQDGEASSSGLDGFDQDELACFAHHHKPFELCQATLQRWLGSREELLKA